MADPPSVTFKVVVYGPKGAGKRSCLGVLDEVFPPLVPRGKVQTDWHARDFQWHVFSPPTLGLVDGYQIQFYVITHGCDRDHPLCRKDVLLDASGVIFVADSSDDRQKENLTSWYELHDNLRRAGLDPSTLPIVIYYNKRDVVGAIPVDAMNAALNPWGKHPWQSGSTRHGGAVVDSLKSLTRAMIAAFRAKRSAPKAAGGAPPKPQVWPCGHFHIFYQREDVPHPRLSFPRCAEITPPGLRLLFLGDYTLRPEAQPLAGRPPLRVDGNSISKAMADLDVTPAFTVPELLFDAPRPAFDVRLRLRTMADFSPDAIIEQIPALRGAIEELRALDGRAREDLHRRLSRQVDEILHHPSFLALEASWRGLKYLLDRINPKASIYVDVLSCSKEELLIDFEDAPDTNETWLAKILKHEESFPYTAILGDFDVSMTQPDMFLLKRCAALATAARAPFLAALSPTMLGLDTFTGLSGVQDPEALVSNAPYQRFEGLRATPMLRDAALLLPRFLLRYRYGDGFPVTKSFSYQEGRSEDPTTHVWGNPVYAFAARLAASFTERRACDAITGLDGGGVVQALPMSRSERNGETITVGPLEGVISPELAKALTRQGLMSFVWVEEAEIAYFPAVPSLAKGP